MDVVGPGGSARIAAGFEQGQDRVEVAGRERALADAGIVISHSNGRVIAEAEPGAISVAAMNAKVPLLELRPADDGGLKTALPVRDRVRFKGGRPTRNGS